MKAQIEAEINTPQYVSVTTDLWTGCHQRRYMSLTAHYVGTNWELQHRCLQTREVSSSHDAENLSKELHDAFEEWGIAEVFTATTDNGRNIRNAIVNELNLSHLGCVGHTLQLSIGKALQLLPVAKVLGKVRKLVAHFHKSTKATYALREKQVRLDLPQHQLVQECETRWGSTFMMLSRVQEQQPALCATLMESKDKVSRCLLPDGMEWNLIEELLGILKPFHDATTVMSGSKYPTFSLLAPLLYKLLDITLKVRDDSSNLKAIKKAIATDLQERYRPVSIKRAINIAAFLDPRFKDLDPFVKKEVREDVIEDVKMELLQFPSTSDNTDQDAETEAEPTEPASKKKRGALSYLFADVFEEKAEKKQTGMEAIQLELQRYQGEECIDIDEKPLLWWKSREAQYPTMVKLVRQYFSIPATSVRSEELFSTAGNVLTENRNRLLPENVDRLVFLHENLSLD